MVRLRRAAVWAGAILLGVAFVAVGLSKFHGASALRWSDRFRQWGYPANTAYVVGALEILGGIGVLIPRWRRVASLTLVVLMTVALCTHLVHAEFARVIPPLVLGGVAFLVYWSHRREVDAR
jgi:uncharacterized membrane protein YphA (DoxX/SURF4 family)